MSLVETYSELRAEAKKAKPPEEAPVFRPKWIEAEELLKLELGEMKWAIEGLIPEGACILAGAPKMGKSWLALNLAMSVAWGGVALGKTPVEQGKVLYLALEDGLRRLQGRIRKLLEPTEAECPKGLRLVTRWAKYKDGGLAALAEAIKQERPRLVIIDTLERVRNGRTVNGSLYSEDYEAISVLQELGIEHGVAILIITHVRKQGAMAEEKRDPLEEVSGSMGLTGAADVVLVLKRPRQGKEGKLFLTGRDVEEREIPLVWDAEYGIWSMREEEEGPKMSREQRGVIAALEEAGEPMGLLDLLAKTKSGKSYEGFAKMVARLARDGAIEKDGQGRYMSKLSKVSTGDLDTLDSLDTEGV